jgi:pimeloyl-ACP methyl ester carboxylesterase
MPKLDRDGVGIHYEVEGRGPAVLLTHGFSATGEMWRGQVAALKDRFTVITCAATGAATIRKTRGPTARPPQWLTWPPCWTPWASSAR